MKLSNTSKLSVVHLRLLCEALAVFDLAENKEIDRLEASVSLLDISACVFDP